MERRLFLLLGALSCAPGALPADSTVAAAYREAERAYSALKQNDLDGAVAGFRRALELDASKTQWRKDLAYVLLRTGDREAARDHFERLWQADRTDGTSGLEFAFLCFETRREREAHQTFQTLRNSPSPEVRATAEEAFERIDRMLAEGIARWEEALKKAPGQWSAHEELARLAERRNDDELAVRHYREAWRLRPEKTELLVDLARVLGRQGAASETQRALSTAWHFGSPRVREAAIALNGGHEPGAVEPWTIPKEPAADGYSARQMARLSLEKSYLRDAYRYYREVVSQEPGDFEAIYQLGVVSNLLGKDREAADWFRAARAAPDPLIASRSREAYAKLWPAFQRFRVTAWAIPFFSSRWRNAFLYGQGRAEWRPTSRQIWLYGSYRVIGDTGVSGQVLPAGGGVPPALSERTMILGGGVLWKVTYRLSFWGEAGEAYRYANVPGITARFKPDYRGGFSYLKGWGRLMGSPRRGWFSEASLDGFYVSRFNNDMLLYSQARGGYTFAPLAGGAQVQILTSFNFTRDRNGEYWGNVVEAGPGIRIRFAGLPPGMSLRADFLRGAHLDNSRNPLSPNYWDLRAGVWYAQVF
ncbi:MAG: tetratricopeptide repeat protein [Bryobacteraceae bacterium]|nr:tetratricopeptide repeat protein [Bryobacteraceae bacterium]